MTAARNQIERTNLDLYRSLLELNVVGVLAAMQEAIPLMRRQGGGVIVNISSGTTKMVLPGVAPYASTKQALNALTLAPRAELAGDNIRVGLVYPWVTATDFMTNAIAAERRDGDGGRRMAADSPDYVASLILEAVQTESAETYAENVRSRMHPA